VAEDQVRSSLQEDGPTGVVQFLRVVRKSWALVLASAILGAGLALIYSKSLPRIYEASAMVELNATAIRPLGEKSDDMMALGASPFWDNLEYYETQYKIVTSQRVLGEVVRNLNLSTDASFLGLPSPPATPTSLDLVIEMLRGRIRVEPVKGSRLFLVHVQDTDTKRAVRICDAIAETYVQQNLDSAVGASADAAAWLAGQLDRVGQDLKASEDALYEFKRVNDLPSTSINEASNMVRLEMQEFDTALSRTKTQREELQARVVELSKISEDNVDQLPASELLGNGFLQQLRTEYLTASRERNAFLAEGKGANHPLVKRAEERVAQATAALLAEIKNIKGAVEKDLAVVTRQEAGDRGLYLEARRVAVDLNMKEIEYHRLDRTREENDKLHTLLLEHMKEADLARMMHVNNVRLVDHAVEPRSPVRPQTVVNMGVGLGIGLLLGVGLAWLRVVLDRSIKTPADVEQLRVTFLGLLPRTEDVAEAAYGRRRRRRARRSNGPASDAPAELVVHTHAMSGVAEAARSIRTNLLFMSPDKPYRTVLGSSAAPAEGKTTVACSIAIALAQGGQRVCIVDCDLRRPRLHRIFNRAGDTGVTSVLVGDASIEDVAKPTVVPNLWSVPAGPLPPNPADLLHSDRFRRLVSELSTRFDRVIIDSAPLVAVTDSAIISTIVDGTIFVVRAFETTKQLCAQGLRSLRDVESPIVGAVLNAVDLSRHEYSYQYHYYYYHKRHRYGSTTSEADEHSASTAPN
jgi:succinoglycan biosynthesis transport protein ExoP